MESFANDVLDGEEMDARTQGLVTGMFALGAIVAAFPAIIGFTVGRIGRKGSIILGGSLFCLGAATQALAPLFLAPEGSRLRLYWMYLGRFVAGGSVGMLSANIPIY